MGASNLLHLYCWATSRYALIFKEHKMIGRTMKWFRGHFKKHYQTIKSALLSLLKQVTVSLFVCLCLSVSVHVSLSLSFCHNHCSDVFVCLSVSLSVCLKRQQAGLYLLSTERLATVRAVMSFFICLSVYLRAFLSVCLSVCLSLYLSLTVSLCLCLSVCRSVCLSVWQQAELYLLSTEHLATIPAVMSSLKCSKSYVARGTRLCALILDPVISHSS